MKKNNSVTISFYPFKQIFKMKHLAYLFLALIFFTSCNDDKTLSPSEVAKSSTSPVSSEKLLSGGLSEEEYGKFINEKLKGSRALAYTEHGPFTTPISSNVEIPGTSGSWNVWKILLSGIPNYVTGNYFCRYYEHSYLLTLPAGQYIVPGPGNTSATNIGYQGNNPPNPIGPTTDIGVSYTYYPGTNQYKFTTYSLLPKYNVSGQDINSGNVRLPTNFSSTQFTYKYYTL